MLKYISICLIFISLLISNPIKSQGTIIFDSNNCNKWVQAETGKGSFYVNTTSDYVNKNGYFYFNIFFYSNASNNQGYLTAAYIENVDVSILAFDQYTNSYKWKSVFMTPYVLVQPKNQYTNGLNNVAYVYSTNLYQKIKVTWSKSSPY